MLNIFDAVLHNLILSFTLNVSITKEWDFIYEVPMTHYCQTKYTYSPNYYLHLQVVV